MLPHISMVTFFRLNTIDRFITLLLLFLAVRSVVFIWPPGVTVPEMWWLTLGEALSRGELLYKDVYDDIAPLSGLFYTVFVWLFGKNFTVLRVLAAVALLFQMLQFGGISKRYQLYGERNFVPELSFAVCSLLMADGVSLSPMILANFFLLSVFSKSLKIIKTGVRHDEVFMTGMHLGVAFLFYQPTLIFLPVLLFVFLLYSGSKAVHYLLLLVAVAFPAICVWIFYFWYGHVPELTMCFFAPFYKIFNYNLIGFKAQLYYMLLPMLLMIASLVLITGNYRFIHFQNMAVVFMAFWMGAALLMQFLGTARTAYTFHAFIVPMAFFMAHWVQLIQRKLAKELTALAIMLIWIGSAIMANIGLFSEAAFEYRNVYLAPPPAELVKEKRVMTLVDDPSVFWYNALASPFLKPDLFGLNLFDFGTYHGMLHFYKLLVQDKPDVIWDPDSKMVGIFAKLPILATEYAQQGPMYVRISNQGNKRPDELK